MTVSKSQIKAQAKYDKANTIQIKLKLNKKTDADIIRYLSDCKNKQGTIKALIRLYVNCLDSGEPCKRNCEDCISNCRYINKPEDS